jgi:hypothetical protein
MTIQIKMPGKCSRICQTNKKLKISKYSSILTFLTGVQQ